MSSEAFLAHVQARSSLVEKVKVAQCLDLKLGKIMQEVEECSNKEFSKDERAVRFQVGLCVPNVEGLKREILEEAHCSAYTIHPGATKMYLDLK